MGFFDFLKGKPQYSEIEVAAKAWAGVKAYQEKNFSHAVKMFTQYFEMKGFGNYPKLDADDYRMTMNLMFSQFYCGDYANCKETCKKIINMRPSAGEPYAFSALCSLKLGNRTDADNMWSEARKKGSQIAGAWESIDDAKIEGYN